MSSFDPANQIAERNLIFAGIALEKGLIETHHINHAFTIWVCDKSQHLGDILVEMKVLTSEQKQEIDREVTQKLAQENVTVLSTMDCLEDLSSELNFLDDSNLKLNLGDAKKAKSAETPPVPESPPDPASKQGSGSSSKQDSGSRSGPVPPETSGSDRFEPVDYLNSQGGMGELWRSRDKELNRYVVVKYIKRFRAQDPHLRGLFHLEGEVTGHLEHPNIPPVYSLGKDTLSRDYFAMRYFKGRKLTEEIRDYHGIPYHNQSERKEKLVELLQSFQTACLTVEFAHNRGIVHCDIKPDNIMVGEYGETLVIDWGLVVVKGAHQPIDQDAVTQTRYAENFNYFNPSKSASSGLHVKQGGSRKSVGGTLAYMPPEQLQATENGDINLITYSSDVFGLGATLYHLLVGRAPYLPKTKEKETKSHFYDRIRKGDFVPPRTVNQQIPKALESIVKKAMACDPSQRYATPRELADDIRRWLSDEPTKAHPEGVGVKLGRWLKKNMKTAISTSIVAIALFGLGSYLLYQEQVRTKNNFLMSQEIAKRSTDHILKTEPFLSKSNRYISIKKNYLQDMIIKYDKLLKSDPENEEILVDYFSLSRVLYHIWRTEHNFPDSERNLKSAIAIFETLKKRSIPKEIIENWDIQLKRDIFLMDWEKGKLEDTVKGFGSILNTLDQKKRGGVISNFPLMEEVLATFVLLDTVKITGKPLDPELDPGSRLDTLKQKLKTTNWKNPEIHEALLLKTIILYNLQKNQYSSVKLVENADFQHLNSIVEQYNSRSLICERLPEPDYLFWIHGSIVDMIEFYGKKSPSVDLLAYCDKSLVFFDKLTQDYPAMTDYLDRRITTYQKKANLENSLGKVASAQVSAKEGLKHSQYFLTISPNSYKPYLLVINSLFQIMKFQQRPIPNEEEKDLTAKISGLIDLASTKWPELPNWVRNRDLLEMEKNKK